MTSRYLLLDPHGFNSTLARIIPSEQVQIESNIDAALAVAEGASCRTQIIVSTDFDLAESLRLHGHPEVFFARDVRELTALRLACSRTYKPPFTASTLDVVCLGGDVDIGQLRIVTHADQAEPSRLVCAGGRVSGGMLTLFGGDTIIVGHGAELSFGRLSLGKGASITIEQHASMQLEGRASFAQGSIIYLRDGACLKIGDEADCGQTTIHCFHDIRVGRNLLAAHGVELRDGDGHDILGLDKPNYPAPLWLGNHVWLASGSTVLKGVSVGDGCIVAAAAVLTCTIPPNCLAAGVPAVIIRRNISWTPDYSAYRSLRDEKLTHRNHDGIMALDRTEIA